MSFGFSVGDVIAGTSLLITSINAVKDSNGASSEYRAVTATLKQTCAALEGLNDLRLNEAAHREALEVAASQCGATIFQFVNKISKFRTTLDKEKDVKNWKAVLRKLEWSFYSKEDVRRFQAQLQGDLLALQTTLGRVQLAVTLTGLQETQAALIRVETRLDQAAAVRLLIMQALSRCFEEFRGLLLFVFYSNMRIINALLSSPERSPQVQEERPIYLDDPHGRIIPIPRLWINDWEDFEALLKIQFKRVPGLQKILSRQYLLKDAASSTEISRLSAIDSIFVPGRKISMTMVFTTHTQKQFVRCPKCFQSKISTCNANSEPQCLACGTLYTMQRLTRKEVRIHPQIVKAVAPMRRFEGWQISSGMFSADVVAPASERTDDNRTVGLQNTLQTTNALRRPFPTEYIEDFSRVHIIEVPPKRTSHLPPEWIDKLSNMSIDLSLPGDEGDDSVMKKLRLYETSDFINTVKLFEDVLVLDADHGLVHAKREFSRSFVASTLNSIWHGPLRFDKLVYGFWSNELETIGLGPFLNLVNNMHRYGSWPAVKIDEYLRQELDHMEDSLRNGTQILSDILDLSFELPQERYILIGLETIRFDYLRSA